MRRIFSPEGKEKTWREASTGDRIRFGGAEELVINATRPKIKSLCCPVNGVILVHDYEVTSRGRYKFSTLMPKIIRKGEESFYQYQQQLEEGGLYKL